MHFFVAAYANLVQLRFLYDCRSCHCLLLSVVWALKCSKVACTWRLEKFVFYNSILNSKIIIFSKNWTHIDKHCTRRKVHPSAFIIRLKRFKLSVYLISFGSEFQI